MDFVNELKNSGMWRGFLCPLGTTQKWLIKRLEKLNLKTKVILKSTRTLRRVVDIQKTCCHLISSKSHLVWKFNNMIIMVTSSFINYSCLLLNFTINDHCFCFYFNQAVLQSNEVDINFCSWHFYIQEIFSSYWQKLTITRQFIMYW